MRIKNDISNYSFIFIAAVYNQVVRLFIKMKMRETRRSVRRKIIRTQAHRIQVDKAKGRQVSENIDNKLYRIL